MDDEEYIPCVCCMMGQQQENGFCLDCNDKGCEEDFRSGKAFGENND